MGLLGWGIDPSQGLYLRRSTDVMVSEIFCSSR